MGTLMIKNPLPRSYKIALFAVLLMMAQGCVAQKKATVHQTLKGDNSTVQAMQGEVELPDSGFRTLSELTDRFARDLAEAVGEKKIYLDRTNIRDANTRDVANFSIYLENELDASLSNAFQPVDTPDDADYLIGSIFQKYGNSIRIFFKYHNPEMSIRKTLDYSIERLRLPADSLKENIRSKAYSLAANIIPSPDEFNLYLNPVMLGTCNCATPFSRSFITLIRTELVRLYPDVQVCSNKPLYGDVKAIKKKTNDIDKLESTDAVFAGADTVLEGTYFPAGDKVRVDLVLKDLNGHVLNAASVEVDRDMIHTRLDNPVAEKLSEKVDKKKEVSGDVVNITTTKGSKSPVYHEGELIIFLVQTKKPLYLYVYNFTVKDDVTLLYPYEIDSNQSPTIPGSPLAIPDETDDFELEVLPPFGMDVIKVFASPVKLPIPKLNSNIPTTSFSDGVRAIGKKRKKIQQQLSIKKSINPNDLVDYYRGLSGQLGVDVFEDSLIIETGK